MPIYEYHCSQCKCDFETLVWSKQDQQEVRCPKCNGEAVERILSCFSTAASLGASLGGGCGSTSGGFS